MTREYFVYEIACSKDERVYIGMSHRPGKRFKAHLSASRIEDFPLYRAIREYGKEAFSWRPLAKYETRKEALDAERAMIHSHRILKKPIFNGNLILEEDRKSRPDSREKHITIRPRVGSALERFHDNRRREIAGLAHEWAELEESGWLDQFRQAQHNESKEEE